MTQSKLHQRQPTPSDTPQPFHFVFDFPVFTQMHKFNIVVCIEQFPAHSLLSRQHTKSNFSVPIRPLPLTILMITLLCCDLIVTLLQVGFRGAPRFLLFQRLSIFCLQLVPPSKWFSQDKYQNVAMDHYIIPRICKNMYGHRQHEHTIFNPISSILCVNNTSLDN